MNEPMSATERYLQRLGDALEALGPAETSEVLTEVWSHITDATSDAGGDEDEVLARFGSPEVLAARILEERGVIRGGPTAPQAEGWRRISALVLDAALWLVMVWILAMPVVGIGVYGSRSYGGMIIAWVAIAALAAATLWWWVKKRRERGYTTLGMKTMGLRRIRVGDTNRLVRERDVPGLVSGRGGRIAASVGAALALVILVSLTYSILTSGGNGREADLRQAVQDAGVAASVVTSLYRDVSNGAPLASVEGLFAPSVSQAAGELATRRSEGLVDSYAILDMNLLEFTPWNDVDEGANQTLVSVSVGEYASDSDEPEIYDYRVGLVLESVGDGGSSGQWLIQSVEGPHQ